MRKSIYLAVALVVIALSCTQQKTRPARSARSTFDKALAVHLNAIGKANLEKLEPTVADSVWLISPTGQLTRSKKSYMELHRTWFANKNWEWRPFIERTEVTDSLGYALVRYLYAEKDSLGTMPSPDSNYLVLIFRNTPAGWQLIHDQNTAIGSTH